MAEGLSSEGILVAIGGWLVALLIAGFTFITNWKKGGVEETAVVLTKWKELVEAHERQINGLVAEVTRLTRRVAELEHIVEERGQLIEQLQKDLDGERRNSQQQALSFARELKRLGHNDVEGARHGPEGK